jgi:hypothetical protein
MQLRSIISALAAGFGAWFVVHDSLDFIRPVFSPEFYDARVSTPDAVMRLIADVLLVYFAGMGAKLPPKEAQTFKAD